jgi:hypothetical protein
VVSHPCRDETAPWMGHPILWFERKEQEPGRMPSSVVGVGDLKTGRAATRLLLWLLSGLWIVLDALAQGGRSEVVDGTLHLIALSIALHRVHCVVVSGSRA